MSECRTATKMGHITDTVWTLMLKVSMEELQDRHH